MQNFIIAQSLMSRLLLSIVVLAGMVALPAQAESSLKSTNAAVVTHHALIDTNQGNITVALYGEASPVSVQNFISYAQAGHYNDTIFHRVINNFMIQGGGFTADIRQKPTRDPIKNEADNGLSNDRGTVAMARTNSPNSATAQFFINVRDNAFLNHRSKANGSTWGYAVFGRVIAGMDAVDAIKLVPTARKNGMGDVPVEPVIIQKITVTEK